jgi:hypothetical protein
MDAVLIAGLVGCNWSTAATVQLTPACRHRDGTVLRHRLRPIPRCLSEAGRTRAGVRGPAGRGGLECRAAADLLAAADSAEQLRECLLWR